MQSKSLSNIYLIRQWWKEFSLQVATDFMLPSTYRTYVYLQSHHGQSSSKGSLALPRRLCFHFVCLFVC